MPATNYIPGGYGGQSQQGYGFLPNQSPQMYGAVNGAQYPSQSSGVADTQFPQNRHDVQIGYQQSTSPHPHQGQQQPAGTYTDDDFFKDGFFSTELTSGTGNPPARYSVAAYNQNRAGGRQYYQPQAIEQTQRQSYLQPVPTQSSQRPRSQQKHQPQQYQRQIYSAGPTQADPPSLPQHHQNQQHYRHQAPVGFQNSPTQSAPSPLLPQRKQQPKPSGSRYQSPAQPVPEALPAQQYQHQSPALHTEVLASSARSAQILWPSPRDLSPTLRLPPEGYFQNTAPPQQGQITSTYQPIGASHMIGTATVSAEPGGDLHAWPADIFQASTHSSERPALQSHANQAPPYLPSDTVSFAQGRQHPQSQWMQGSTSNVWSDYHHQSPAPPLQDPSKVFTPQPQAPQQRIAQAYVQIPGPRHNSADDPQYPAQPTPAAAPQARSHQVLPSFRPASTGPRPQHRKVAHVQIPVPRPERNRSDHNMASASKRRRSNEGDAIHCETPQSHTVVQHQTNHQSDVITGHQDAYLPQASSSPALPSTDYQPLLLALADDYVSAAHSMSETLASPDATEEDVRKYHRLISTCMGCLQSVLQNYRQPEPRKEARIRLRLATLLHEETENSELAEDVLSRGISLCERNRLMNLKYTMHHLLVQVIEKRNAIAGMKAVDKLIAEVETLKITRWVYAFRFLRNSLALTRERYENAAVLKNLTAISMLAKKNGHVAVEILAAVTETLVHLRSGSSDALEWAQRAIAAARTHQLSEAVNKLPQVRVMLDFLDLTCALLQYRPDTIIEKLQHVHRHMDGACRDKWWKDDRHFLVPLGPVDDERTNAETAGIMSTSDNAETALVFEWLNKPQVYTLGYLLSGVAATFKGGSMRKPQDFLTEAERLTKSDSDRGSQSYHALLEQRRWHSRTHVVIQLQLAMAKCAASEWTSAAEILSRLRHRGRQEDDDFADFEKTLLCYAEAVCEQGSGFLESAERLYAMPELTYSSSKELTPVKDLQMLATLNHIPILREQGKLQQAADLFAAIEPYADRHRSQSVTAALYLLKATDPEAGAIIKVKQNMQTAVQAAKAVSNNQLLCIVMCLMTQLFFSGIVGEQAVKSSRAGRTLAQKIGSNIWEAIADRMYGDTLDLCGHSDEAPQARHEAQVAMAKLPQGLKDRFAER